MNKIFLFISFSIISFPGIAQGGFPNADSVINYLEGGWSWYRSCGGIAGYCKTPSTEGYNQGIRFQKINNVNDSIDYKVYKNSLMTFQGRAKISSQTSNPFGTYWQLNKVQGLGTQTLGVGPASRKDTARLFDVCIDCFDHEFKRDQTVSLSENNFDTEIKIYPNPVLNQLYINSINEFERATAYDVIGKKTMLFILGESIDVKSLKPGVYLLELVSSRRTYHTRFIKE